MSSVQGNQVKASNHSLFVIERAAQSLLNKLICSNLVNTTNQVEVHQRDPNSPLYSVKSFEELRLKPQLLQGVYTMGFNRPSKIQQNTLRLDARRTVSLQRTAAFVLAMLSHVDPNNKFPQCLCVSPTYELALQTGKVIEQMGKYYSEVKLVYAIRGNKLQRGTQLQEQVVIGTPGTMLDWTPGPEHKHSKVPMTLPKRCPILLFSATFEEMVWNFAHCVVPDPQHHQAKEETLDTIKQYYVICHSKEEKFMALCDIYGAITIAQAMIVCHVNKAAGWLAGELSREGHQVALLSEMQVEQRAAVIDPRGYSTNHSNGSIDVEQVSVVLNFDLPVDRDGDPDNETYLHRIGRTGRFGKRGLAINMVDSKFRMNKIENLDTDDLDEIEKIAS
uniref:RNA helicase n=1 Tax=Oncorhynchus tshawytscha TaxID=74940 RepID=A0A8C8HE51_ONCTS